MPVVEAPAAGFSQVAKAVTPAVVQESKRAGVSAMSLSLDGSTPARHDAIRGVLGCTIYFELMDALIREGPPRWLHEGVAQAMEDGALGLSSSLQYVPDRFASTDEFDVLISDRGLPELARRRLEDSGVEVVLA